MVLDGEVDVLRRVDGEGPVGVVGPVGDVEAVGAQRVRGGALEAPEQLDAAAEFA